jgi:hypothetical protein
MPEKIMLTNQTAKPAETTQESLWTRMLDAWARSFELLAQSKSRFPLDV